MNTFLDRIRSSVTQPETCEARYLPGKVKASKLQTEAFIKASETLIGKLKAVSGSFRQVNGSLNRLTYSEVDSSASVVTALNALETHATKAGFKKIEAVYSPASKSLIVEFSAV